MAPPTVAALGLQQHADRRARTRTGDASSAAVVRTRNRRAAACTVCSALVAGADLARHQRSWRGLAVPRPAAAGDRDPDPVRDSVRLGLGRILDGDDGFLVLLRRPRPLRDFAHRGARRADRRGRAHRDRDADLQRGRRARVRRICAPPTSRSRAPAICERFDFFVLTDSNDPDTASPRSRAWLELCRAVERLRPHLLPLAPAPDQAQERQHRRLLPPLGQQLPLHGRARRRQRDERRVPDDAGAA